MREQPERFIDFQGVSRAFGNGEDSVTVLSRVDLAVEQGEFVCVIGPSGCGKSTLLNMVAGLLPPSTGKVVYDGQEVTKVNTRVGYVTQSDDLLPWRTVRRNLELPLEVGPSLSKQERRERTERVLKMVGLEEAADRYPAQLSGGMRKRTILGQTLIYEPETILMDEPFGALDAQMRHTLQGELVQIWERYHRTIIFVTHDLEEAILLGDRVVVIGDRPGRIIHNEKIEFERPRDLASLRADPVFADTWSRLWGKLESHLSTPRMSA